MPIFTLTYYKTFKSYNECERYLALSLFLSNTLNGKIFAILFCKLLYLMHRYNIKFQGLKTLIVIKLISSFQDLQYDLLYNNFIVFLNSFSQEKNKQKKDKIQKVKVCHSSLIH